ncbi:hypothetical protein C1645_835200 [Glomus cerebriforme]|uniref:Uncharacterized protein n=1 Tax=Glomus cerebriforme TaxID=658196 RepID=A0A397SEZ7_9GLOM|nr:hypothetical protein C1645_835200 [Glomus cerebriforme]
MSNTQSIDSLRELNVKFLAEITELRKKFAKIESENAKIPKLKRKVADVEVENAKLKQIIEENAKRDVRVKELEQKNTKLEARLAIVEQSSMAVDGQSKNDKEAIAKQSAPSSCIYSNVEIKVEVESTEKCFAKNSSSDDNLLLIPDYSQGKQDQSLPSCVSDQKSLVDREIDTFLDDVHKKSVSDGIRRHNKEKLLRETASLKVLPSAENNLTVSLENDKIESSTKTVSSGNDQSHVPLKITNGDAFLKLKVNVSTTSRSPIPRTTYDQSYFRNKTLGQYPTLYREFSSENFDYYGITDETSCDPKRTCPLCSLDHNDEKSIEGKYKAGSYFIKCEQHEIEIIA